MECMCAQTRPWFILSPERVLGGMEFELMLSPRENPHYRKMSPEEDRTRDTVDSKPKHYQRAIPAPRSVSKSSHTSDFKIGTPVVNLPGARSALGLVDPVSVFSVW